MPWARQAPTLLNPTWNVTDQELLKRLNYHLLENGNADATTSPTTAMFSQSEMLAVLNQRQQKFLRDTACVQVLSTQGTTPQIGRYVLPTDWIHTRRLAWQQINTPNPNGSLKSLVRTDAYQLDHGLLDWQQNFADPTAYNDGSDLPTLTVELAKAPSQAGQMELLYVPQPQTLDASGVGLNIPDEAECALLFGSISDLLGSEGEGHDPERAQFCETMYQLVVDMTNSLLGGASDEQ